MDRVLSALEMKSADNFTINTLNISETELISRAGNSLAEFILSHFTSGKVLFLIGKGNNGKDGEAAFNVINKAKGFIEVKFYLENDNIELLKEDADIIVDCIFGVGLNREIKGKYLDVIKKVNEFRATKIACDIPSGINANSGKVLGVAFRADYTVCMQEYKYGHFLNDGIDYCGKLIKKDVGISVPSKNYAKIIENCDVKKLFPKRKRNSNKGQNGLVAILGGSKEFFGSALLSANSLTALKMGAGYSYLYIPESLFSVYAGKNPEVIIKTVKDKSGNMLCDEEALLSLLKMNSIAFGMGAKKGVEIYKIAQFLLKNYKNTLILDADALNSIAEFGTSILKEKNCQIVLTPHVKEFSRLSNYSVKEIEERGVEIAKAFAKEYEIILVLKSAVTIITDGETVYLNVSGTSGMAKAGSGDVLSGIIAGVLRENGDVLFKTACSCYIFGKAGELARDGENDYTITASDVIKRLARAINE